MFRAVPRRYAFANNATNRMQEQHGDTDTFVYDYPDSSDYTIGIIVDPCKVSTLCLSFVFECCTTYTRCFCVRKHIRYLCGRSSVRAVLILSNVLFH